MDNHASVDLSGCPSTSVFRPTCCKTHRDACTKPYHIETSQWVFESESACLQDEEFEPMRKEMLSTQRKKNCIQEMDQLIEKETRNILLDALNREKGGGHLETEPSESTKDERNSDSKSSRTENRNEDRLAQLKQNKIATNPYVVLLNRLDEEEGFREPSTEDKLKIAENRLRISTNEFCMACENLVEKTSTASTFIPPEKVEKAFRPIVLEPSLRPPQTLSVSETKKESMLQNAHVAEKSGEKSKELKVKGGHQQGFYLPSNTWFTKEKEVTKLNSEELELLNSTSTKAFFKFLEERKKEPPKVLKDIQRKLEKLQKED